MNSKYIVIGGVRPDNYVSFLRPFERRAEEGIVLTREPGGTQLAEEIRTLLFSGQASDRRVAVSLIRAARVDHEELVIRPALERGCSVICNSLNYSHLEFSVKREVYEESVVHAGFSREWLLTKPTLLILIMPTEEDQLSVVLRNIGSTANHGLATHQTEVVYVDSSGHDSTGLSVNEIVAEHLEMISSV